MNENSRWVVGGLVGILGLVIGTMLSVQGTVDRGQNVAISETKADARRDSERNANVLERITIQQTETANQLMAVAQTLKEIDARGTRAYLRSSAD